MERIRRSFQLNGWPQNQLMTAFTPSRVMCKSFFLFDGKAFSLSLRCKYGELQLDLSRIWRVSSSYDSREVLRARKKRRTCSKDSLSL